MERRRVPKFEHEAEEADWWYDNPPLLAEDFVRASQEGRLGGRFALRYQLEEFESVWDAIADRPEEAANLRLRAELMLKIEGIVKEHGWTVEEAAGRCGVAESRMNDLLRGRFSVFLLEELREMFANATSPARG